MSLAPPLFLAQDLPSPAAERRRPRARCRYWPATLMPAPSRPCEEELILMNWDCSLCLTMDDVAQLRAADGAPFAMKRVSLSMEDPVRVAVRGGSFRLLGRKHARRRVSLHAAAAQPPRPPRPQLPSQQQVQQEQRREDEDDALAAARLEQALAAEERAMRERSRKLARGRPPQA